KTDWPDMVKLVDVRPRGVSLVDLTRLICGQNWGGRVSHPSPPGGSSSHWSAWHLQCNRCGARSLLRSPRASWSCPRRSCATSTPQPCLYTPRRCHALLRSGRSSGLLRGLVPTHTNIAGTGPRHL